MDIGAVASKKIISRAILFDWSDGLVSGIKYVILNMNEVSSNPGIFKVKCTDTVSALMWIHSTNKKEMMIF